MQPCSMLVLTQCKERSWTSCDSQADDTTLDLLVRDLSCSIVYVRMSEAWHVFDCMYWRNAYL
jgi:hypothetical protein